MFLPVCTVNAESKVTAAHCLKDLIFLSLLVHYFPNNFTEINGARKYSASPCDRASLPIVKNDTMRKKGTGKLLLVHRAASQKSYS